MKKISFLFSLISIFFLSQLSQSQIPQTPTNLHIQNAYSSALYICWNDNSNNESGFVLERSQDGNMWMQLKMFEPDITNYSDIGLFFNTRYYYRVYAYNASGRSDYSNVASGRTMFPTDCSVGTDTISTPYPFYSTYTDSRTQILYKKSEMIGLCTIGNIWSISFYNKGTTFLSLGNITIKMKSTTDTILTKFIDTGMTVVLNNSTIYFYGSGWNYINLSPPFVWDINKNLLIEICFHTASSLTNNINVRGTTTQNKVLHRHKALSNGCTLDSGVVQNVRPNFSMNNIVDGVKKITGIAPDGYSIDQNYPNPFNGNTKFKFRIKEYSPVTLSLYDVLGRQEVVVFSEPLGPGEYEKIFSLSDHPLPSGIYYYVFVTNGFVSVKKLVVLK